jgi:uncharacterized protein YoxC
MGANTDRHCQQGQASVAWPWSLAFPLHTGGPMTELVTRSGAWLLQQAPTLPDTFVMKTVAAERGWFEVVTSVASGVLTLTILGLAVVLGPAAWSFWRSFRKVRALLDKVYADITPLTHHASNIADNLDYITTSIRNDVQQVNATIASANRRLHKAVELTEDRLNEFNALLHVVQQEAEHAFVSTAAAVHGVRTGAATLGSHDDDDLADEGEEHDDDSESDTIRGTGGALDTERERRAGDADGSAPQQAARPRLRPRRRARE